MKIFRPITEKYHGYTEGETGRPIQRHGEHLCFYKKGFWKRNDRKKFFREIFKNDEQEY